MVANKSPKPSLRWKSVLGQTLFVVMLLLIARVVWMRQQPERLPLTMETNDDSNFMAITDDTRYVAIQGGIGQGPTESTIWAQSLRTGEKRALCKEDTDYIVSAGGGYGASIGNGNLYYVARLSHPPTQRLSEFVTQAGQSGVNRVPTGTGGAVGSVDTSPNLGTFLVQPSGSPGADVPGQKRIRSLRRYLSSPEARFRQVSLQGGTPRDATPLQGEIHCLVGDHGFWIQPATEETATVTHGDTAQNRVHWTETSAHSDLMLTDLAHGTTRCIRHGIPRATRLTQGTSGVSWKEPSPYPKQPTLCYARAADGVVCTLGSTAASQDPPRVAELGNKLYWPTPNSTMHPYTFMSANLDGTAVQEVGGMTQKHPIGGMLLYGYKGNLYGCLQDENPGGADPYPLSLFRLHPDRADPIEILRKLSGRGVGSDSISDMQFGGGYLYFQIVENPGLWDSQTGIGVRKTLCRIPLEH